MASNGSVTGFEPRNPDWEARVREAFGGQGFMALLGAQLERVEPGSVAIIATGNDALSQQHGFVHAGVLASLCDTAAGFAALTLSDAHGDILTAEFKINLLRPAEGRFIGVSARVVKAGRMLTVSTADALVDGALCAVATVTLANPAHRG